VAHSYYLLRSPGATHASSLKPVSLAATVAVFPVPMGTLISSESIGETFARSDNSITQSNPFEQRNVCCRT
jgi:hypothetical protein